MATATARTANASAQTELERRMLRQMLLIRRFEEKAAEAYALGKIGGFCHLYIGQEAVAGGSLAALRDDDYVISSYREHGQALTRGVPATAVMAELYGKATGCSKGKGGSMHLFDAGRRFLGGHGIVGGHIPLAAGIANPIPAASGKRPPTIPWPPRNRRPASNRCIEPPLPLEQPVALPYSSAITAVAGTPRVRA